MKSVFIIGLFALVLSSCAHHRDVRPGDDGVHRVVVRGEEAEPAARDAMSQANHFCKEQNKYAAIVSEEKKYVGSMDEKTYNTTKTAGRVAKTVGGAAYVFGGKNESNAGGLIGLGGMAADAAAGEGYQVEMKFKCK